MGTKNKSKSRQFVYLLRNGFVGSLLANSYLEAIKTLTDPNYIGFEIKEENIELITDSKNKYSAKI